MSSGKNFKVTIATGYNLEGEFSYEPTRQRFYSEEDYLRSRLAPETVVHVDDEFDELDELYDLYHEDLELDLD